MADTFHRLGEARVGSSPSARAWLSQKSRQFLGFSTRPPEVGTPDVPPDFKRPTPNSHPAADSALGGFSRDMDGIPGSRDRLHDTSRPEEKHGQAEACPEDTRLDPDGLEGTAAKGLSSAQASTVSYEQSSMQQPAKAEDSPGQSGMCQAEASPREPEGKTAHVSAGDGSLQIPKTVFASTEGSGEGMSKPVQRRQLQVKSLSIAERGTNRAARKARALKSSVSQPSSTHASERDVSSNDERGLLIRGFLPSRPELPDQGSVSLAYSEHDGEPSSETDASDGGGQPSLSGGHEGGVSLSPAGHRQQSIPSSGNTATLIPESCTPEAQQQERTQGGRSQPGISSSLEEQDSTGTDVSRLSVEDSLEVEGPVFVPIVMSISAEDQALLLEQRYSDRMVELSLGLRIMSLFPLETGYRPPFWPLQLNTWSKSECVLSRQSC